MKAVLLREYGGPELLQVEDVEQPKPGPDEVLIKIVAAAANAGDWHLMRGEPFLVRFMLGLFKPKPQILGGDVAGVVEAVGEKVTTCKVGDAVFGDLSNCGFGAYAEYVSVPQEAVILKPQSLSFEEAAAIPIAAITALQALRDKGNVCEGMKVLINGASGGVGTYLVQIAKAYGAEVTAVCSTKKQDMVRELGADFVIDYKTEDFTKNGLQYDLIVAANGDRSIFDYSGSLAPGGRYVMIGGSNSQMFQAVFLAPFLSLFSSKKLGMVLGTANPSDLKTLAELAESGKIKPVIDRHFNLEEAPEAIRYLEEGHARGKVIVRISAY